MRKTCCARTNTRLQLYVFTVLSTSNGSITLHNAAVSDTSCCSPSSGHSAAELCDIRSTKSFCACARACAHAQQIRITTDLASFIHCATSMLLPPPPAAPVMRCQSSQLQAFQRPLLAMNFHC
jgi:hypothetical protein